MTQTPPLPPLPDITFDHVRQAAENLRGVAHRTPVLTSRLIDAHLGAKVFFKPECLQRTGSFKFRGACNAVMSLSQEQRRRGVIAYSSGNHAQGLALACSLQGVPCTIVMPADAPAVKRAGTEAYGAEVVTYARGGESRESIGARLSQERGLTLIPPFDHPAIIAGQGTAALELFEELGELDAFYVCVGGGGLLSGCALAARGMAPRTRVIGVEPAQADDGCRSFHTGVLHQNPDPETIADGARTTSLGELTFPLIRAHVDEMISVSEDQIVRAMGFAMERLKVLIEPTGALGFAGALQQRGTVHGRIGVLISGGNVDLRRFATLFGG